MAEIPSVSTVMTRSPVTVEIDASVLDAQSLMIDHEIRHLPVVEAGQLVGIVSDRDIAALDNDARSEAMLESFRVRAVCSLDHYSVSPQERLDTVLLTMADRRIGSVVVTENGRPVGVFTATDACRSYAERLRSEGS